MKQDRFRRRPRGARPIGEIRTVVAHPGTALFRRAPLLLFYAVIVPSLAACSASDPVPPAAAAPVSVIRALEGRTIAVDAAHGGRHGGVVGPSGLREKEVTLEVALELETLLKGQGARVFMTRTSDVDFSSSPLEDVNARRRRVNEIHPDLYLSLHAHGDPQQSSTRGYQVRLAKNAGPLESKNRALARAIRKELAEVWASQDRGTLDEGALRGLQSLACPSALVEMECITHPSVEAQLRDRVTRRRLAEALAKAVQRWVEGAAE